jgi:hypothetical protein
MFTNKTTRTEFDRWIISLGENAKYVLYILNQLCSVQKVAGEIEVANTLAALAKRGSWGTIKTEAYQLGMVG